MDTKLSQQHRNRLSFRLIQRSNYRLILRAAWLGAIATVIVFSLLPGSSPVIRIIDRWDLSDKIEHIGAYAVLAFLPVLHERARLLIWLMLLMVLMGVGLEFGQLASDGRSFELEDILADCAGLFTGIVAGLIVRPWMQHRSPNAVLHFQEESEIMGNASLPKRS